MNIPALYHLYNALTTDNPMNLRYLDVISALSDNDFPIDIWLRDGLLDKMVYFVDEQYRDYMSRGYHDIYDFCYCLHDICEGQGPMYVEHPDEADLEDLYAMLDEMN